MPALEILALDTVTPRIRAPAVGDTYSLPRSTALAATVTFGWSTDLVLHRDAANTLAQRNGITAQTFNLYNTYTDASNYERLEVKYSANIAILQSLAAGTGTVRTLRLKSGGGSVDISNFQCAINADLSMVGNPIKDPSNITGLLGYLEVVESTAPAAPATNNVRIYAEDNGGGKTRLMAKFATGAAVQIAIEP